MASFELCVGFLAALSADCLLDRVDQVSIVSRVPQGEDCHGEKARRFLAEKIKTQVAAFIEIEKPHNREHCSSSKALRQTKNFLVFFA
ncbi:MAG: hypothetical protein Q8S00_12885 [Deltaproteobacteria bacterium]|nr:hypothetical protein [Deltaproteobacteria bacterium]